MYNQPKYFFSLKTQGQDNTKKSIFSKFRLTKKSKHNQIISSENSIFHLMYNEYQIEPTQNVTMQF